MAWRHRLIESKKVYEICFRAREGIPLPCLKEINFLVECAIAWALRDQSVTICSVLVMGNHIHMIVIAYDPSAFTRFYGELAKRLTDSVKRLAGKRHLRIWESRAMVALIADIEACKKRIEYIYLNPARAHLVESIQTYPGVSSWETFLECSPEGGAHIFKELPHITMPDISACRGLKGDSFIEALKAKAKERDSLKLRYYPFAWIELFNTSESPGEIRTEIVEKVYIEEDTLKKERLRDGREVMKYKILTTQTPLTPYLPKKYERKIFVISTCKELRKVIIEKVLSLSSYCKMLYQRWKLGEIPLDWPLGMFKPSVPLLASCLNST